MSGRLIMALSGPPGVGKSTHARYLADTYGFSPKEGSDCIRDAAKQMGRLLTVPADYESIVKELQLSSSVSWIADRVLDQGGNRPLHVGLRTRQDFHRIHQVGGLVVALTARPDICISRINKSDPGRFQSEAEYLEQLELETSGEGYGSDTLWVVDRADYRIDTSELSIAEVK
jgi:hypothetical protein